MSNTHKQVESEIEMNNWISAFNVARDMFRNTEVCLAVLFRFVDYVLFRLLPPPPFFKSFYLIFLWFSNFLSCFTFWATTPIFYWAPPLPPATSLLKLHKHWHIRTDTHIHPRSHLFSFFISCMQMTDAMTSHHRHHYLRVVCVYIVQKEVSSAAATATATTTTTRRTRAAATDTKQQRNRCCHCDSDCGGYDEVDFVSCKVHTKTSPPLKKVPFFPCFYFLYLYFKLTLIFGARDAWTLMSCTWRTLNLWHCVKADFKKHFVRACVQLRVFCCF